MELARKKIWYSTTKKCKILQKEIIRLEKHFVNISKLLIIQYLNKISLLILKAFTKSKEFFGFCACGTLPPKRLQNNCLMSNISVSIWIPHPSRSDWICRRNLNHFMSTMRRIYCELNLSDLNWTRKLGLTIASLPNNPPKYAW